MQQRLGSDPVTAYGLARQDDGTVLLAEMMGIWNTIEPKRKHGIDDLPEHMRREEDRVVSDVDHPPIRLDEATIMEESFRLAGEFRAPDEEGWYNASNIVRVARGIGMYSDLGGRNSHADIVSVFRDHPLIENRVVRHSVYFRPRIDGPEKIPSPVRTSVLCSGERSPRELPDQATFGDAYRAVMRMTNALVSHGTTLVFEKDAITKTAAFDADSRAWVMSCGTRMKRTDPDDPVLHRYRNGRHVGGLVGFVSSTRSGRIYANAGIPVDSPGDDDAVVGVQERTECDTVDEALAALNDRDDLDHVFSVPLESSSMMGFWLASMKDSDT